MGEIGINLSLYGNTYFGAQYPFLDRFKTSSGWSARGLPDGTLVALDSNKNPIALPAGATSLYGLINVDPIALATTDRYVLTYSGVANVHVGESRVISSQPGKIVFEYAGDNNIASLQILSMDPGSPIHDIHVVREDQQGLYNAGQIFGTAFLDKVSSWGVVRFMDWGGTNGSQIVNWNDRAKVTDATWGSDVPLEVMTRLSNDAHSDMWYNIPAHASDDFVRQALTLIRDNLDPSLKLHLEYSNEVWNWGFEQSHYAMAMATQITPTLPADFTGFWGDHNINWVGYYGYRSAQIAAITDQVFGSASNTRVDNVISTQTAYIGLENYVFDGIRAANVGTAGDLFEEYAITTYFGDALSGHSDADKAMVLSWARSGGAGLDAAFQQLTVGGLLAQNDSLANLRTIEAYQAAVAARYGMQLVAYEGGLHAYATSYANADQATVVDFLNRLVNDPRMGTLYTQMSNDFTAAGGGELVAYSDVGATNRFGAWGLLDNIYQNHSVRYDALQSLQTAFETSQQAPITVPPVVVPPVVVPPVVVPPIVVPPVLAPPVASTPPVEVTPPPVVSPPVAITPPVVSQTPTAPVATLPPQTSNNGAGVVHTVESMVLAFGAEISILDVANPLTKTAINLTGNEFAQRITGNDGANIIVGGGGADTLLGLGGNDTFLVQGQGEAVIEAVGGGNDTVFSTGSYNLGANEVETLSTVTHSDTAPINLIGNFISQRIIGNYGDNILNGGSGVDTLIGLAGNDLYAVGDTRTIVVEAEAGGNDTVVASVDFRLGGGASVETLAAQDRSSLVGLRLTGNDIGQVIAGTAGSDTLNGGGGRDILIGGAGADRFDFTSALAAGHVSTIADFDSLRDKIGLSSAIFGSLGSAVGSLEMATGVAATTADHRLIYDSAKGQLFFDADGVGGNEAILFAVLSPGLSLTPNSFEIIAPLSAI